MSDRWIVDASPLILLANAGYEHLLAQLADELLVPQAVAREVRAGPKLDRARQLMVRRYWKVCGRCRLWGWGEGIGCVSPLYCPHTHMTPCIACRGANMGKQKDYGYSTKSTIIGQ